MSTVQESISDRSPEYSGSSAGSMEKHPWTTGGSTARGAEVLEPHYLVQEPALQVCVVVFPALYPILEAGVAGSEYKASPGYIVRGQPELMAYYLEK